MPVATVRQWEKTMTILSVISFTVYFGVVLSGLVEGA